MITLTNNMIREFIAREGLGVPPPGQIGILGLRGAWRRGPNTIERNENFKHLNEYNDSIVLFGPVLEVFAATCDPGQYWTERPMNTRGTAHLKEGSWAYRWGIHRGHKALVQSAPVTVIRDIDKDGIADPGEKEYTGWFGINIHAGGTSPEVNKYSAGCQVIQGGWDGDPWRDFIRGVSYRGQRHYNYYLLKASRIF